MKILLDNGHGQDTPGKRSPDGGVEDSPAKKSRAFLLAARYLSPENYDAVEALIDELGLESLVRSFVQHGLAGTIDGIQGREVFGKEGFGGR